jgi:predicted transcriptional regulator
MRKIFIYLIAISMLLCLFTSPVFPGIRRPVDREKRKEIYEKIRMLRLWRMAEYLDLDTETGLRIIEEMKKYEERHKDLMEQGMSLLDQLKSTVDKNASDEEISAIINKIRSNMDEQHRLKMEKFEATKKILTVTQQAKYILFEIQFMNRMADLARRAFGRNPNREPRPPGF